MRESGEGVRAGPKAFEELGVRQLAVAVDVDLLKQVNHLRGGGVRREA
jgi:hypothetical protein